MLGPFSQKKCFLSSFPQPHGNHSFYQNTTLTAIIVTRSTEKHTVIQTVQNPSRIFFDDSCGEYQVTTVLLQEK